MNLEKSNMSELNFEELQEVNGGKRGKVGKGFTYLEVGYELLNYIDSRPKRNKDAFWKAANKMKWC